MKEREYQEVNLRLREVIKMDLNKYAGRLWNGIAWFEIGWIVYSKINLHVSYHYQQQIHLAFDFFKK